MSVINLVYAHTKTPGFATYEGDFSVLWRPPMPSEDCDMYAYQYAYSNCGQRIGIGTKSRQARGAA